tara:strand:- start:33 stop:299 length:267 start_codon:yes stop_codon:yes gene_type:complete
LTSSGVIGLEERVILCIHPKALYLTGSDGWQRCRSKTGLPIKQSSISKGAKVAFIFFFILKLILKAMKLTGELKAKFDRLYKLKSKIK